MAVSQLNNAGFATLDFIAVFRTLVGAPVIVGGTFFYNRVINRWNRLDQQTVGASSLNVFKTRLSMIRNTTLGYFMD